MILRTPSDSQWGGQEPYVCRAQVHSPRCLTAMKYWQWWRPEGSLAPFVRRKGRELCERGMHRAEGARYAQYGGGPEISASDLTPSDSIRVNNPRLSRPGRAGPSYTIPVYSCTADAPAANMRQTCSGSEMPPHETMLACLPRSAATSAVIRSVLFSSGAPLRPPLPTASRVSSTGHGIGYNQPVGTGVYSGFS